MTQQIFVDSEIMLEIANVKDCCFKRKRDEKKKMFETPQQSSTPCEMRYVAQGAQEVTVHPSLIFPSSQHTQLTCSFPPQVCSSCNYGARSPLFC